MPAGRIVPWPARRVSAGTEAFLPGVLEIQERVPSPLGRALLWLILSLVVTALVWAWRSPVDIVAVAEGRVVPVGRVRPIQPLAAGIVRRVLVHEGQQVRAGQLLLTLDPTLTNAERRRVATELTAARAEAARLRQIRSRLRAAREGTAQGAAAEPAAGAPGGGDDAMQRELLASQWREYQAQQEGLRRSLVRQRAELRTLEAQWQAVRARRPLLDDKARALARLARHKLAARQRWQEAEQARVQARYRQVGLEARLDEARAALAVLRSRRRQLAAGFRREILARLLQVEGRIHDLEQALRKAARQDAERELRAPVAGIVDRLRVPGPGTVVAAAQRLMQIVPLEAGLEVEARVLNRDIGFVHPGQAVVIKALTFPFTRYGAFHGRLDRLGTDAQADRRQGLVFLARIRLASLLADKGPHPVRLAPGMRVRAEIHTGQRRLLEYLLSPLLAALDQVAHER